MDEKAVEFGRELRQVLFNASGLDQLHSYVNYAHGDETVQEMYGFESWRQKRLRELKRKYDPQSRFSFYAPIDGF